MTSGDIPVSVIVMTRDEAECLPACLAALTRFAQVFVVDSASGDGTAEIAGDWACAGSIEVVDFHWNGRLPKKKQWCLDNLPFACRWALFVDADEVVTAELADEIAALFAAGPPDRAGYYITGRPVFLGRELRFGWANRKLALIDRTRARFPAVDDLDVACMWEVEGHFQPQLAGPVGRLKAHMLHDDRKPLAAWFMRHARYAQWEAALSEDGRLDRLDAAEPWARRWAKRLYRRLPFRPLAVFLVAYLLRLGFLDGRAGLTHAAARAVYCWQVAACRRDLRRRREAYGGRG